MRVGLSIGGGVSAIEDLVPQDLAADGFSSVFFACYEDEMRWEAQTAADFTRDCVGAGLDVYAVPLGYGCVMDPDGSGESLYLREQARNCQVDSRGRRAKKACPNNPAFLEWFSSNMRTLAWLLECRGFLWDEPAFYYARGAWACRCDWCRRLFFAQHQEPMPQELIGEVPRFRRNSLLMFLLAATAAIHAVDRRLESVVMPTCATGSIEAGIASDQLRIAGDSSAVDVLSVYAPWQSQSRDMEVAIRATVADAMAATRRQRKPVVLWVGGSPHPRDRLLDALRVARDSGVEHVVIAGHQTLTASVAYESFRPSLSQAIERMS